ncbi:MAG: hypothetical protein R3B09_15860 [Nannocystaceae bacterium]
MRLRPRALPSLAHLAAIPSSPPEDRRGRPLARAAALGLAALLTASAACGDDGVTVSASGATNGDGTATDASTSGATTSSESTSSTAGSTSTSSTGTTAATTSTNDGSTSEGSTSQGSTTSTTSTSDATTSDTDATTTTGVDEGVYIAHYYPGGLDRVMIRKAELRSDRCTTIVLVWPGGALTNQNDAIERPAEWGIERAWIAEGAEACLAWDPLDPPEVDNSAGAGAITWSAREPWMCPHTLDLEVTLDFIPGDLPWVPLKEQLSAAALVVDGCV